MSTPILFFSQHILEYLSVLNKNTRPKTLNFYKHSLFQVQNSQQWKYCK